MLWVALELVGVAAERAIRERDVTLEYKSGLSRHLLCAALFTLQFAAASHAFAQPAILNAGLYQNKPKIFYDEAKSAPAGIWVDILNSIAEEEGWRINYVRCKWSDCLAMLMTGELDIMPDVAYSEERAKLFDFNREIVLTNWTQVYTRQGSEIDEINDLDGKTISTLKGGFGDAGFKRQLASFGIEARFMEVDSFADVMRVTSEGRAEAGLVSRFYGLANESEYNLKRIPIVCCPAKLFFAAQKGKSAAILSVIDRRLAQMKKDTASAYHQSLITWLEHRAESVIPLWVKFLAAGSLALLALFITLNLLLRKIVQTKTRELDERNRELRDTLVKLDQSYQMTVKMERLASLGAISSGVMHEILNPINIISTSVQMMQMENPSGEIRENLDVIMRQIGRATKIANNMRMASCKSGSEFQDVDVNNVLDNTISLIEYQMKLQNIDVKRDFEPSLPLVKADRDQLAQVFLNLLNNSRDALEGHREAMIHVATKAVNGSVLVSVADNGPGIPADMQSRIFEQFYTTKTAEKGTGLGLYLVKEIIEGHNGSIKLESGPGGGTTFVVSFQASA